MKHQLSPCLSTLGLALLVALPTHSQGVFTATSDTAPPSLQLPRVVVTEQATKTYNVKDSTTATKTDTPISLTPFSIQVIGEALIQDQQAYRIEDVIRNVSGVSSQAMAFSSAYETLQSRGFSTQPFRDGVRMMFITVPLANAQSVEVLKGPAAVQYGRVEPGGHGEYCYRTTPSAQQSHAGTTGRVLLFCARHR
jgi:outer membrane receptor protein involved in Fe transport